MMMYHDSDDLFFHCGCCFHTNTKKILNEQHFCPMINRLCMGFHIICDVQMMGKNVGILTGRPKYESKSAKEIPSLEQVENGQYMNATVLRTHTATSWIVW